MRGSRSLSDRHNAHIHFWRQDARQEAGTVESEGWAFTYSHVGDRGATPFLRFGWSDGDAAQMRRFVGIGATMDLFGRDKVGAGLAWGSPPERELRDQVTAELFYRIQLTQTWRMTPSIQVYYQPSYNPDKDWITVLGLRTRVSY